MPLVASSKGTALNLNLLPRDINNANRNAIDRALRFGRRKIVDDVKSRSSVKLSKRELRQLIFVRTTTQADTSGELKVSGRRITLSDFAYSTRRYTATRAAVDVDDRLDFGARRSGSAFVNPRHNERRIMRRIRVGGKRAPRQAVTAAGPSLGELTRDLVDAGFDRTLNAFYVEQLDNQIATKLRRKNG